MSRMAARVGSGAASWCLADDRVQMVAPWSQAPVEQRLSLRCLEDRSSRPHRLPRLLRSISRSGSAWRDAAAAGVQARSAGESGHPHATVWRTLRRAGISRPSRQSRELARCYEWPFPGDLLHIDSKRFARFSRPGHMVTGDRYRSGVEKRMRMGHEFGHSPVDDHSRLAYSELHRDEPAGSDHPEARKDLARRWARALPQHGRAREPRLPRPPVRCRVALRPGRSFRDAH
jgi:hypothetical protein